MQTGDQKQKSADRRQAASKSSDSRLELRPVTKHDLKQLRKLIPDIPDALRLASEAESAFQSGNLEKVVELVESIRAEYRTKHYLDMQPPMSRSGAAARAELLQRELIKEKAEQSLEQFGKVVASLKEMARARQQPAAKPPEPMQNSAGTGVTGEDAVAAANDSADAPTARNDRPPQAAAKAFQSLHLKFTVLQQALGVVKLHFKGQVVRSGEDIAKQIERIAEQLLPDKKEVVQETLARVKDQQNVFAARVLWWLHLFRNLDGADSHVPEVEKTPLRKERDAGKGPADIASKCFDNLIATLEQWDAQLGDPGQAGAAAGGQRHRATRPQPVTELSEEFLNDFEFAGNLAAKRRVVQRTFVTEPFRIEITGSEGAEKARLMPAPKPGGFVFLEDQSQPEVFQIQSALTRQGLQVRRQSDRRTENMPQKTFLDHVRNGVLFLLLQREAT